MLWPGHVCWGGHLQGQACFMLGMGWAEYCLGRSWLGQAWRSPHIGLAVYGLGWSWACLGLG
jgi:hypothetical protein